MIAHAAPPEVRDPLPVVRRAVRSILESTPEYGRLGPAERQRMARSMVAVCHTAATLLREEMESEEARDAALATAAAADAPVASAMGNAGQAYSGVATERIADTTRRILNAVSFPRFVTELINGVFKAVIDSNQTQLQQYLELLNNVATTTEGFADANMGPGRARQWLVERFPDAFELTDGMDAEERREAAEERRRAQAEGEEPEPVEEATIRLRPGARAPTEEALRTALGIPAGESVPSGDPERVLVPLARRWLARQRQGMLATLVMLGMQRIVVDSGRITAAMRFHIDTRSAAESDVGSRFDLTNQVSAQGSFGVGAWGASAAIQNTIGYVSTEQTRTTESTSTDLELTSSVELNFHSDYLPLNRMASEGQQQAVAANTLNPQAEFAAMRQAETTRRTAEAADDTARRAAVNTALQPTTRTPLAVPALPPRDQQQTATRPAAGGGASGGTPPAAGGAPPPAAGGATPPAAGGATPPAAGGVTPPAAGGVSPPAAGGANPPAAGGANPPAAGGANPPAAGGANPPAPRS